MNKSYQIKLAWVAVWGVMLLSVVIGVLPNIAMFSSGDTVMTMLGLVMILSIPVMEIAAALLAYTVLSQEQWSVSRRTIIAVAGLALALSWNAYNIKRGLDMAPNALTAQAAMYRELADERAQHARESREAILTAQREGRYVNSRNLEVSASRADREAAELLTKASLISAPAPAMLVVLTMAMKIIELTLLYVVSVNRPKQPWRRRKQHKGFTPKVVQGGADWLTSYLDKSDETGKTEKPNRAPLIR